MTNKRRYLRMLGMVTAIALAMSLFLLGCGGSSGSKNGSANAPQAAAPSSAPAAAEDYGGGSDGFNSYYSFGESDAEAPAPEPEEGSDSSLPQFVMPDTRKIIRHVSMDLETREFANALQSIQQTVADAGGYIESQNQDGYSLGSRSRYQERYASIQARIPSARLDEAVRSVGGFCNVLSQSEKMDDITESYFDSQARLTSLKIQEERLLAILEKADKLEDVITLENALSEVRYEIESLTASLRRMDSQVAYSYLNISLREVVEYQEIQEKPQTFGEKLRDAFGDGIGDMVDGLQSFVLFIARVGPSLVVLILIVVLIVILVRAGSKASAKRREAQGLPPRPTYQGTTNPQAPAFQRYPQPPPAQQPPAPKPEDPQEKK